MFAALKVRNATAKVRAEFHMSSLHAAVEKFTDNTRRRTPLVGLKQRACQCLTGIVAEIRACPATDLGITRKDMTTRGGRGASGRLRANHSGNLSLARSVALSRDRRAAISFSQP